MKINVANQFTYLRIVLSPVFYWLVMMRNDTGTIVAAVVFTIAAVSDYFDGWAARKFGEVTRFGVFLDPLADKFLTTTAFFAYASMDFFPLWMVFVVLARDVCMTALRIYADRVNQPVVTSWSAKAKTFLQLTFISYILLMLLLPALSSEPMLKTIAENGKHVIVLYSGMIVITGITLWTAIEYFHDNRKLLIRLWKQ